MAENSVVHACLACITFVQLYVPTQSSNSLFGRELFGTKTPYFWYLERQSDVSVDEKLSIQYAGQECPVVYTDGIFRHGARYPCESMIREMNELKTFLTSKSGIDQFIINWVNVFTADKQMELSSTGINEMKILGSKMAARFHSFLDNRSDKVSFYSSDTNRAIDSAKYFSEGLGNTNAISPNLNNNMLRFYDHCKLYEETVTKGLFKEYDKFIEGTEVMNVMSDISSRVGGNFDLTYDQVAIIRQICAFELGVFNKSVWCDYFRVQDLEVLDYAEDIENYMKFGYVHRINYKMTCPLLRHVFQQMEEAIKEQPDRNIATFRFTHWGTVSALYAALGLFNDTNVFLASDYQANQNRQFRTSTILPFSASVVFVLYKCNSGHMVKLMVNEEEKVIPACGSVVCPYTTIKENYAEYVDCDFDKICENMGASRGSHSMYAIHSSLVMTVLVLVSVVLP